MISPLVAGSNPTEPAFHGELAEIQIQCQSCGFSKSMLLPDPPPSQTPCPGYVTLLNIIGETNVKDANQEFGPRSQGFTQ